MIEEQQCIVIKREELLARVQQYQVDGYRLAQICCTKLAEVMEINYSFDRNYALVNLRVILTCADLSIPSISKIYWGACFYENEMHDLFGLTVENMAVDYQGNFYTMSVKFPFGCGGK